MRARSVLRLAIPCFAAAALAASVDTTTPIDNPAIDMDSHLRLAVEAARHRASRRVSEDEFMRMSREPGTIVLDARSREKYDELHVRGALNLSFPDIALESLAELIPDTNTRILIYCNNNFRGAERAFPSKIAPAALNLSTYVTLYSYGYRNVYELGPLIDIGSTRLPLEPSAKETASCAARPRSGHVRTTRHWVAVVATRALRATRLSGGPDPSAGVPAGGWRGWVRVRRAAR